MPIHRTTVLLAALFVVGLGHVLFFEPRLKTTAERRQADRRVLQLLASEVQRIKVRRDHWTSALIERSDRHGFRVVEPAAVAIEAEHVLRLLSTLEFLHKRASFASGGTRSARDYGLDPPQLEISVATDGGREIHLAVGQRSAAGDGVYVKVLGEDAISVVSEELSTAAAQLLDAAIGDADRSPEGARDDAGAAAEDAPGGDAAITADDAAAGRTGQPPDSAGDAGRPADGGQQR